MTFNIYYASALGTWSLIDSLDDVVSASQRYGLNEISRGNLSIPATSADRYAVMHDRLIVGRDGTEEICAFIIDKVTSRITPNGTYLDISGPDMMHELTRWDLGTDTLDDGAGNPATDDLAQTIAYLPSLLNWAICDANNPANPKTGTTNGTMLTAAGESVLQMLRKIAEQSGEVFRLEQTEDPTVRLIGWFSQPPPQTGSGSGLVIPANPTTLDEQDEFGVILSGHQEFDYSQLTTSASVFGAGMGAQRLTLAPAEGYVSVPYGWSVDWTNSIITTSNAARYRTQHRKTKSFSNVRPADSSTEAERAAAIALFHTAIAWLKEVSEPLEVWRLSIRTRQNHRPGDYIYINPLYVNGQFDFYGGGYYIQEVTHTYKDQKRTTELTLSERPAGFKQPQDSSLIMRKLEDLDQTVRHTSAASSTTGETPSLMYHDQLLGRTDPQNHTQYLLTNGGRPLAGNMPFVDGVKIDGMDPSVHLTQPNAHHNWPLLEADIPVEIARVSDLHNEVTLAADSDPILTLDNQQLRLGDVTTQAEFNALVNQDLRSNASPTFWDLTLTDGLLLYDRTTSTLYRLFVQDAKVYLETVS